MASSSLRIRKSWTKSHGSICVVCRAIRELKENLLCCLAICASRLEFNMRGQLTRRVGGAGRSELQRSEYADAGQCMPVAGALLSCDRPPRCSVFSLFSSSLTVFSPGESYPRMHVSSSIPTWYPSAIFSLQHIWRHRPSFISLPSAAAPSQLPQLFSGNVALPYVR